MSVAPRLNPVRAEGLQVSAAGLASTGGLSFTICSGLSFVTGGEGRGKTLLLRLIAGLVAPSAGALRRHADSVFLEHMAEPAHDPVAAQAWLDSRALQYRAWDAATAASLVSRFGLTEHLAKPLYMLSTGSRRKVGLVAAAASGAALTLLDTPFAALDAPSCRVLESVLSQAAGDVERAWVVADYAVPVALAGSTLGTVIDLGD